MTLSIKDLDTTRQLDRKAMTEIRGGNGKPPGLLGYEGQPGNQGGQLGSFGMPLGLLGYEGQPGNQGG